MKIYVIGSCRVHGPLRHRREYQRVIPGYTHTAKEAIQRIQFVRDPETLPGYVAQSVFSRDRIPAVTTAHRRSLDGADVVIVEICSAKDVSYKGHWANLNYVHTHNLDSVVSEVNSLHEDIKQLAGMVNRLVVVQHVEVPGLDDRSRFALQVRNVCADIGVPVFNPSLYVGANDMLDVNHYKPNVVKRIGVCLMEFIQ